MLILAIDTALDACAAAVLDTDAGKLIAQESQAMKRGHAEALMPLIARVMKASGVAFAALDRIAVTTGPGSFTGLRVGLSAARGIALAAGKPVVGVTTLTAYAAPIVSENGEHPVISAIDARHDHVYFQVVGGDGSSLIKPKVAPIAEALDAARFGAPHLVGNAAKILADRWPADAPPPVQGRSRSPRPISPGWRGSAPRSIPKPRRHGRIICARPTPSRRRIRCRRSAAAGIMMSMALRMVERRHGRGRTGDHARRARGWRNCTAHRFTAAGAKANSRSCWPSATRSFIGCGSDARSSALRCRAWRADEAEILSIAVDAAQRGRGLSRNLLLTHLGHLAGRGVRTVFLEVEENNQPARRLYEWAGFEVVGRRERYYQQPGGEQLNALLMRRDLS